jgi:hypothetical protein
MENEKMVQVKSLTIKIGEREIEMTVEEAKNLKGVLDSLFEKEIVVKKEIEVVPQPYPVYPNYPWWTQPLYSNTTDPNTIDQYRMISTYDGSISCKINTL